MSDSVNIALNELHKELFDLSARNPLLNCKLDSLYWYDENQTQINKLWKKARLYEKEYALETLLHIHSFIKWSPTPDKFYISPLIVSPTSIVKKKKINDEFTIETEEEFQLNPVWEHYFKSNFDYEIPPLSSPKEFSKELQEQLSSKENKVVLIDDIHHEGWCIINTSAIGVFNYKKAVLGKDYEAIKLQPSPSIEALINGGVLSDVIDPQKINGVDNTQEQAINEALTNHLTIQGPPGTGKSHTIVALINEILTQGKRVLFVSEKKSALDVVHSRLKAIGLDKITAYVQGNNKSKNEFYKGLKASWKALNEFENKEIDEPHSGENDLLTYYKESLLNYRDSIGCSMNELIQKILQQPNQKIEIKGETPSLKIWDESIDLLHFLEKRVIQEFDKDHLYQCSFAYLNKSVFIDSDPVLTLEKRLQKVIDHLNELSKIQKKLDLDKDLKSLTQLCVSSSVMAMVDNIQMDLLVHDTKLYKSFNNWAKKYELVKAKLNQAVAANKKWKSKPSLSEVIELLDLIKNKRPKRGILSSLKRQRLLNEKFVGFSPQISDEAKIKLLESLRLEWRLAGELEEISIKLNHNLGIENPEHDIKHIRDLRRKLDKVAPNDYMFLLEQENHLEVVRELANFHPKIQELQTLLRFIFDLIEEKSIQEMKLLASETFKDLPVLTKWLEEVRNYFKLPSTVRNFVRLNPYPSELLTRSVCLNALLVETRFEPVFKDLNGTSITRALNSLIKNEKFARKFQAKKIVEEAREQIRTHEKLLTTPASKLKAPKKEEKKALRQSKKVLFNELGKRQRFMPVHTFYDQTENWLKDVFKVWIMNPLSVSEQLPLQSELFDYVIFDESSQIPLEDAIPAIHRAKNVIVVGDEHQMPPSNFFSANEETKTLLQQAQFAFKNVMLKWHYRSEHPALIQFSNRLFYENELITFPPVREENPIDFVKVNGTFDAGKNEAEVAQIIEEIKNLGVVNFDKIGVVAFSLQQAELIQKEITKQLPNSEDILVRNLENVQGVERDYIIISVGYGYDEENNFRMNFGPINQESGLNRLNVLVTRAKIKLIVVTSISAFDFKMSDNPGVQTLQDFLNYAEHGYQLLEFGSEGNMGIKTTRQLLEENKLDVKFYDSTQQIGFNAFVQHSTGKILLIDPTLGETEIDDLSTIYGVVQERFSKSLILLSLDFQNNLARTKDKILAFFKL